jgi:hypothetical protein
VEEHLRDRQKIYPLVVQCVCSRDVCQHNDALLPSLTVCKTLRFAGCLVFLHFISNEEKNERAEEILVKMNLGALMTSGFRTEGALLRRARRCLNCTSSMEDQWWV